MFKGNWLQAVIELYKYRHRLKVSTHHIKGVGNTSADLLSRGITPSWLQKNGKKCTTKLNDVAYLLATPFTAWREALSEK